MSSLSSWVLPLELELDAWVFCLHLQVSHHGGNSLVWRLYLLSHVNSRPHGSLPHGLSSIGYLDPCHPPCHCPSSLMAVHLITSTPISWPPISRTPPSRILPVSWSYPCHGGKTRPHDIQEQDTRPRDRGSVKIKDLSPWYWWSFLEPHGGCKVRKGPKVAKFLDR